MNRTFHILGIDPGFADIGYALIEVSKLGVRALSAGVWRTAPSTLKKKVLSTDDNLRRMGEICQNIHGLLEDFDVKAICAESMSYPPSASAAVKMGMCWGVVANEAYHRGISILQASPQEIKKTMCGSRSASKEEIKIAVESRLSLETLLVGVAKTYQEHPYDAAASALTCMTSDLLGALRSLL